MSVQQNRIDMAIEPKSDQTNYDDFLVGSKTITVTNVTSTGNKADAQPISVHYEGDNSKPFKPCKSMRRVMVKIWGDDPANYTGKSMTLYGDPEVIFAGKKVGGIRISHMSDMNTDVDVPLSASKTKRVLYRVSPLKVEKTKTETPAEEVEEYADLYDRACEQAENGMSYYKDFFGALSKADKTRLKDSGDHDKLKVLAEAMEAEPTY